MPPRREVKMKTPIEILRAKCQKWGGDLVLMSSEEFERALDIQEAPFTTGLGVQYGRKTVIYTNPEVLWTDVVHEMAHVFASRVPPMRSDESQFFGWEWLVGKRFVRDIPGWIKGYADYCVDSGHDFATLSFKEQMEEVHKSVEIGKQYGNISKGWPICVR